MCCRHLIDCTSVPFELQPHCPTARKAIGGAGSGMSPYLLLCWLFCLLLCWLANVENLWVCLRDWCHLTPLDVLSFRAGLLIFWLFKVYLLFPAPHNELWKGLQHVSHVVWLCVVPYSSERGCLVFNFCFLKGWGHIHITSVSVRVSGVKRARLVCLFNLDLLLFWFYYCFIITWSSRL